MSNETHLSSGQNSPSPPGHGVNSPGLANQESSWISLVYRPTLSVLQKYLPGRTGNATLSGQNTQCLSADLKSRIFDKEGEQTQIRSVSHLRTLLSLNVLSSVLSQEIKPTGSEHWVTEALSSSVKSSAGKSRTLTGYLEGDHSSQKGLLSELSWAEGGTGTARLCPRQPVAETKALDAETTVFVPSGSCELTMGENTGPTLHKEEAADNGGLQTVQNTDGSRPAQRVTISNYLSSSGAAAACSEVTLLTPDQDTGYSSLEEEHLQIYHLYPVKDISEEQKTESTENSTTVKAKIEERTSAEGESSSEKVDEKEGMQENQEEEETSTHEHDCSDPSPHCQNKAIAFIMGCPCSDDDSSQSDSEFSDDDDDGFDSEGSSEMSDSTDEDDDDDEDEELDSDSEVDSDAERLWQSLSRCQDPYNPRNFTARLHTANTPLMTIPTAAPPSSTQSTLASSPDLTPQPLSSHAPSLSLTSPSGNDFWDDSTSASEVDEAESLLLLSSFGSSDPYSLFNFQASVRSRGPIEAASRTRPRVKKASQTPPRSPHRAAASPPEYKKEEAEERLDSGFSESSTTSGSSNTRSCTRTKKVSGVRCSSE